MLGSFLTKRKGFLRLTKWAFDICDGDGTGQVGRAELYAGILLVHVQLAKYAGAAACYPPSRSTVDALFDASDDDRSGAIDEEEFTQIMVLCSQQIASRIMVYYGFIILLVPHLADWFVQGLLAIDHSMEWNTKDRLFYEKVEHFLTWGHLANKAASFAIFCVVIPLFFDFIDSYSASAAEKFIVAKMPEKAD